MKILWVKAGGLVPPDIGGKIRSYNILRQLATKHPVTFFTFYAAHSNDIHEDLSHIFHRVIAIPLELPPARGIAEFRDYILGLFSREPYNLTKYCRRQIRKRLRDLLREEAHDVILCDFLIPAGAIPWDWPLPKVLFAHNVEAMIWRRHFEVARNPLWKAVSWLEWKRMAGAEQRYLRKANHVITVSNNDRDTFAKFLDPEKITVTPTGADTEFFRPTAEAELPDSLVFTGAMDWLPNEDGISYFINDILPLIRREVPGTTLCIVGRNPSKRLGDLVSKTSSIQLTGWVNDVRPYVAQRAVYIVPLRIGGGTRLKIFEAMSMGKAIVSTSIGAEGLPVEDGRDLLIANNPVTFAQSTIQLLRSPLRRAQIGQAARSLVESKYSWAAVSEQFARVLESSLGIR
jgi:polysaccharide biosynthesis protein PslH